jgi:hypothetical protein
MKRLVTVLVLALVVLAASAVGARAAQYVQGYSAAGEWFSPGEGYGSPYDHFCGPWVENDFSKGTGAWGLITFIDTRGNWNSTTQGYGWLSRPLSNPSWTKKLHCKNNRESTYQGGCYGFWQAKPNCA